MRAIPVWVLAAALLTAGCSSSGGTRPPPLPTQVKPLTIRWQPVLEDTEGAQVSDIIRYEIEVSAPGRTPTTASANPDTGELVLPVTSGLWTIRVRAVSESLGAGEAAETQVAR